MRAPRPRREANAADRHPEIKAGVEQVEKSLRNDENARRLLTEAATAKDIGATLRQLEDERDQIITSLSGTPDSKVLGVISDRAELRARLKEVNLSIESLTGAPSGAAPNEPSPSREA